MNNNELSEVDDNLNDSIFSFSNDSLQHFLNPNIIDPAHDYDYNEPIDNFKKITITSFFTVCEACNDFIFNQSYFEMKLCKHIICNECKHTFDLLNDKVCGICEIKSIQTHIDLKKITIIILPEFECPICTTELLNTKIAEFKCKHAICLVCINKFLNNFDNCLMCRQKL
jgi:hypothetical protein